MYLTPDDFGTDLPVAFMMGQTTLQYLLGAIYDLAIEDNWEQFGTLTPEQMSQYFIALLDSIPGGVIMPIGTIIQSALDNAPAGFLLCNGVAISRTTYAQLFAAIGTRFGAGDGSTTFNLPDMRSRFARGKPNAGSVGDTGGLDEVSLTIDNLAAHQHTFNLRTTSGGFSNGMPQGTASGTSGTYQTNSTGSGTPHENKPPYIDLNFYIAYQ